MHPWLAAHASKAKKMTSTMRCDASTLPAHTAAPLEGFRNEPSGTTTLTDFIQPWFSGMSDPTMHLSAYIMAEVVMAIGAFQFPAWLC
jgi:hypothetical protein